MVGYIARLVSDRGFGFIKALEPDGTGAIPEWFFHRSQCEDPGLFDRLKVKDRVEFETYDHEKGARASGVRRA